MGLWYSCVVLMSASLIRVGTGLKQYITIIEVDEILTFQVELSLEAANLAERNISLGKNNASACM
jgi:hypothetical protein